MENQSKDRIFLVSDVISRFLPFFSDDGERTGKESSPGLFILMHLSPTLSAPHNFCPLPTGANTP